MEPTRADLITTVYRHQVQGLAEAGPSLLTTSESPYRERARWIDLSVDFLVIKHGLAAVLQSDDECFDPLHAYFLERLVPVCARLLEAASGSRSTSNWSRSRSRAASAISASAPTEPTGRTLGRRSHC